MSTSDETSVSDGAAPPSQAIIEAIAAEEGVDVTDVEPPAYDPLFTVVNPEALDDLFTTTAGGASNAVVSFEYEGYEVVVHADGVEVRERSSTDSLNSSVEG
ncbi:HalOD1 output domain-containing protein [Haloarchaeobius amylolyticus]|uniref:HalOD1 output domain-containing protein n=1 Tax=Haloarchaeobius amylolyticus TaxID=1198296 RepID=A0ABD6BIY0_9EURY